MQPVLKNGDRMWIQVDNLGRVIGTATTYVGKHAPRSAGRWVEITTCIETCCSTTTTTTTTTE